MEKSMIHTMEDVYYYLKANKNQIMQEADNGNETCKNLITYYEMHRTCPGDPGAQAFLMQTIEKHQKEREKEND
jgi:hypothetical protein